MKKIRFLLYGLCCCSIGLSDLSLAQTFFEQHEKGWFWYEQFAESQKKPLTEAQNPSVRMQALQQHIEQSLNLAILEPTEAHLKAYAEQYFRAIHQAQAFTDGYQLMLLNNPRLDYGLQFPVAPLAQAVYDRKRHQSTVTALQRFAQRQGIFFFFKGDCAYCEVFAPVIKAFAKDYGISVVPVSLDGKGLPDFQTFHSDEGIAALLKVQQVPFVVAVNPQTQAITPLSNGAIAYSQLEENVVRILQSSGGINEAP